MNRVLKLQIIFSISIFLLMSINSNAQSEYGNRQGLIDFIENSLEDENINFTNQFNSNIIKQPSIWQVYNNFQRVEYIYIHSELIDQV